MIYWTAAAARQFSYDADNRLIAAVGKYGTESYAYDADGNRTSKSVGRVTTSYTYAASLQPTGLHDGRNQHLRLHLLGQWRPGR